MFKFLKEKLKSAISIFSKKAEKQAEAEEEEKPTIQTKLEPQIKHEEPKEKKAEEKAERRLEKSAEQRLKEYEEKKEIEHEKKVLPKRHEELKAEEKSHKEIERLEHRREEKPYKETEKPETRHEEKPHKEIEELAIKRPERPHREEIHAKHEEKPRYEEKKEIKEEEKVRTVEKEEAIKESVEEKQKPAEKPGFFKKLKERFVRPAEKTAAPSPKEEERPEAKAEPKVEDGFFKKLKEKVQSVTISEEKFNEMFWDLEVAMLENNVAVEVIDKIKNDLKEKLVERPIRRGAVERSITDSLTKSIRDLFKDYESVDLVELAKKKKPFVICFVGVNGSGKTTTIAKIAYLLKKHNLSVVIAAADTFRAAAIDQLQLHADRLGVRLIKQDYGSDAAAVAFDAVKHAESKNKDVVLIDTAGRLHSNTNLMDEMKKVVRVAKPDMVIFVGESITGNDCVEQARMFSEAVQIDGIILSKADVDEKGGAAISISHVTHKPILYIGTGQEYQDLQRFDPNLVIESLGLAS